MAPFDPNKHLTQLKGKDYLEVRWRLVWLRDQHPDAEISTEIVTFTPEIAVVKATVRIPSAGSATGYGTETPQGFPDYLEKSETRAVGRALGMLGYGTQFCMDFDVDQGENGHVADSPVPRPAPRPAPAPGRVAPSLAGMVRMGR